MNDSTSKDISKRLNVLMSLALRQLLQDREFGQTGKRKQGAGDLARYLADMGIDPKDIAEILGTPLTSVRTLLTMGRPRILDEKIMIKLAKKLGKGDLQAVNDIVSARASKKGISSEAAASLGHR